MQCNCSAVYTNNVPFSEQCYQLLISSAPAPAGCVQPTLYNHFTHGVLTKSRTCNTLIDNRLADACFWGYVTPTENCSFNLAVASLVLENREQVTFASALLNFLFFQKFLFSSLNCVELDSDLVLLNFSRMQQSFFSYQRKGGSIKSQVDQLSLYVRIRIQG